MTRTATKSFSMIEKLRSIISKKEKETEREEKVIEVDGSTVCDVSNDKCLLCKKSLPQKNMNIIVDMFVQKSVICIAKTALKM